MLTSIALRVASVTAGALALFLTASLGPDATASAATMCHESPGRYSQCRSVTSSTDGSGVDLHATATTGGRAGSGGTNGTSGGTGTAGPSGGTKAGGAGGARSTGGKSTATGRTPSGRSSSASGHTSTPKGGDGGSRTAPAPCQAPMTRWPLGCPMDDYTLTWACLPDAPSCPIRVLPARKPSTAGGSGSAGRGSGGVGSGRPGSAGTGGSSSVPEVTVADIAHFSPPGAVVEAQPGGWSLAGVPANFVAHAAAVTMAGDLLGENAEVRFTPVSYLWDYGDGTRRTVTSPGRTWEAWGQDELTTTPTSHVYDRRGMRHGTLQVVYSAAFRYLGEDWHAVEGTVMGGAVGFTTVVVAEKTSLVTVP